MPRPRMCLIAAFLACAHGAAQQPALSSAIPVEPIQAIVDAFRSHPIVAIGDPHGNEQAHAFRMSLIRDPRFATEVNDIVVEFGSSGYQDLMDVFLQGEDVPPPSLHNLWRNTTQIETTWDLPIYEDFFRAIRTVNAALAPERRLRVLLGDPAMDWSRVRTADDLRREIGDRDLKAVDVIRREVLDKGRHALVIYGDQHLTRNNEAGIVARLEKSGIAGIFSIHPEVRIDLTTIQPGVASWTKPSLALLRGTVLGATAPPGPRQARWEDQFDAILYLGPPSSMSTSQLPRALCSDRDYMTMRLRRLSLLPPPPDAPFDLADHLRDYCALPDTPQNVLDREPQITAMFAQVLRSAANGEADPDRFEPEMRDRLVRFARERGPMLLRPLGSLETISLIAEGSATGRRFRRYRTAFAGGRSVVWTISLSTDGKIISLDPHPE